MQFLKKIISAALLSVCGERCFAQIVWFTPDMDHTVSGAVVLNNNTGFSPYVDSQHLIIPSYVVSYKLETPQLFGETGFRFSAKTVDFTTRAVYWPLFWNRLNAGVGITYHFLAYDKIFFEQDVLAGLFFRYKHRAFTMTADVDYFRKWTRIYAVQEYIPWLTNNSLAVNTRWSWFVLEHLDFYFSISSYSTYQYLLFWAPDFMTGFDWRFPYGITAGAEFNIQYIDMMTLSSYLAGIELRLFTRWEFK
ncbi:MAG TPA: hypothetical protein DCL73_08670 [Treponema sp.]|nr:hypothetical protein [Treponema sp.]